MSLDDMSSLRPVSTTTQLDLACRLAEDALDHIIYVTDEGIKQYWYQYGSLRDTTHHQSPSRH